MRKLFIGLAVLLTAGSAVAASPQDVRAYIQSLDDGIDEGYEVLGYGDLHRMSIHSRHMKSLVDDGQEYGPNVFAKPYGYCYAAGIHANALWQEMIDKSRGKDGPALDGAMKQYEEYRAACLDVVDKVKE